MSYTVRTHIPWSEKEALSVCIWRTQAHLGLHVFRNHRNRMKDKIKDKVKAINSCKWWVSSLCDLQECVRILSEDLCAEHFTLCFETVCNCSMQELKKYLPEWNALSWSLIKFPPKKTKHKEHSPKSDEHTWVEKGRRQHRVAYGTGYKEYQ